MTAVDNQAPAGDAPAPAGGTEPAMSAEKQAQKEAKAAQKKAEKEAKKLKALEKQKKQEADKEAAAANASKKAEAKAAAKAKADAKAAEVQAKIDQAAATPKGEKKDLSSDPPDSYHPKCVLPCLEMHDSTAAGPPFATAVGPHSSRTSLSTAAGPPFALGFVLSSFLDS